MRTIQEINAEIARRTEENRVLAAEANLQYATPYHLQTPEQRNWDGDESVRKSRANLSAVNALRWVLEG